MPQIIDPRRALLGPDGKPIKSTGDCRDDAGAAPTALSVDEKPSYAALEEYLSEEGAWLDGQIKAEREGYTRCPVCSTLIGAFGLYRAALEDALETADKMLGEGCSEEEVAGILLHDKVWYEAAKQSLVDIFQQAHLPQHVLQAHPDLRGVRQKMRIATRSKKTKRKAARASRRKNR